LWFWKDLAEKISEEKKWRHPPKKAKNVTPPNSKLWRDEFA